MQDLFCQPICLLFWFLKLHKGVICSHVCLFLFATGLDSDDIRLMMKGCSMVKVRSSSWQKSRSLRLLEDGLTVWCESSKSSRKAKSQQTCE